MKYSAGGEENKDAALSGWAELSPASAHQSVLIICTLVLDFLVVYGKA